MYTTNDYAVNLKNLNPNATKNNGVTIGLFCGGIESCIMKADKSTARPTESREMAMAMYFPINSADESEKKKAENAFNILINKFK